ncbi:hypothetical protein MBLNU230_g3727t2 [Neophaeotheca triangularis]
MADPLTSTDDQPFKNDTPVNGQLATPGLSPISEHGQGLYQPFPDFENAEGDRLKTFDEHLTESARLHDEPPTRTRRRAGSSGVAARRSSTLTDSSHTRALKLSPSQIAELTSSPGSIPLRAATPRDEDIPALPGGSLATNDSEGRVNGAASENANVKATPTDSMPTIPNVPSVSTTPGANNAARPPKSRSTSSPVITRKQSSSKPPRAGRPLPSPLKIDDPTAAANGSLKPAPVPAAEPSPMPSYIPIPPLSLPTYLQLELASDRPSALYIHRSTNADFPYESSKVKFERLLNFLLLPPELEQVLWFGTLACLDSWLYTFTILPLRFVKAIAVLSQWWAQSAAREARDVCSFVYKGSWRMWRRRAQPVVPMPGNGSSNDVSKTEKSAAAVEHSSDGERRPSGSAGNRRLSGERERRPTASRHRRSRSKPSALLPNHKADLLQGLLIILSCTVLMYFDASRMYHSIRGQAAIKLYVIYNVLEVFDRLFSALGQDVLECLFSKETLERKPNGRSKIVRPIWMFLLALVYNVVHATALFYQVVTLNVAVNSYSNALLTLLMSNQFVEIKGTVFKKFEKENLFQLTCADIVERFQLWLMLLIIALRNIVEVGGLTISLSNIFAVPSTSNPVGNATSGPLKTTMIPKAFTLFPKWTGEVLGPFLIVLGSEMLVDWLKHAYINKFNNIRPNIYGRFLDVLTKDYYAHAFADQNLTKRLGLPVIPLSCLFIRASMQTYHMFLASHVPLPIPSAATSVSLDSEAAATSPATTAALQHIDYIFRRALGRSSFGAGFGGEESTFNFLSLDDLIAFATMAIFFLAAYLVLLACKLVLGMVLLNFARNRYKGMKQREEESVEARGRRVGGWGVVEVDDAKRRWIYEDDEKGLENLREREGRARNKGEFKLDGVERYSMAAKRIW